MTVPVVTIDETGCHVPAYADCLTYVQNVYQGIYGQDVYLGPDSQDGQFVAIVALALSNANAMGLAVYNAFSPTTAQGAGLSSVVKVNGIGRKIATYSTADIVVVGQAGITIPNGIVSDGTNQWALPATVTIPLSGQITVTATAVTVGAIMAPANTLTKIVNPTRGWQSVTNPSPASPGAPVETDAALRIRQTKSTALPSLAILDGLVGAVSALSGVISVTPYENDTDLTDANGLPGHTIALVVDGGDDQDVANTIALKKGICGTYGTTGVIVGNAYGISRTIRFFRPASVPMAARITLKALSGFNQSTQNSIQTTMSTYVTDLPQGSLVTRYRCGGVLASVANQASFEITKIELSRGGVPVQDADVTMAFYEQPVLYASNIVMVIQ